MFYLSAIVIFISIIYYYPSDSIKDKSAPERRAPIPKDFGMNEDPQIVFNRTMEEVTDMTVSSKFTTPAAYVSWMIGSSYTIQLSDQNLNLVSFYLYSTYPTQKLVLNIAVDHNKPQYDWLIPDSIDQGYYQILYETDANAPGLQPGAKLKEYSNVFYIAKTSDNCVHPQLNEPFDVVASLECISTICAVNCTTEYLDIYYTETEGNTQFQEASGVVASSMAAKSRFVGSVLSGLLTGDLRLPFINYDSKSKGFLTIVPRTPDSMTSKWKLITPVFSRTWSSRGSITIDKQPDANGYAFYNVSWPVNTFTVQRIDLFNTLPNSHLFTGTSISTSLTQGIRSTIITIAPHLRACLPNQLSDLSFEIVLMTSNGIYNSNMKIPCYYTMPTFKLINFFSQQSQRSLMPSVVKNKAIDIEFTVQPISGNDNVKVNCTSVSIDLKNGNVGDSFHVERLTHIFLNSTQESTHKYTYVPSMDLPTRDDYVLVANAYCELSINVNGEWSTLSGNYS